MAEFPKLKSGAVMQYPATTGIGFRNDGIRFVDGSEQWYRDSEAALRRWVIKLDLLDETELRALEEFYETQRGQDGGFEFTDPADGKKYADCSLEQGEFAARFEEEMRGKTTLTVRENRS